MLFRNLFPAAALFVSVACTAQDDPFAATGDEIVKVSLVSEQNAIVPDQSFSVAVKMEHAAHWHTYWRNPGSPGLPTVITWKLPEGFTAADALWPVPKVVDGQHLFEGVLHIVTEITPPASLKPGDKVTLEAQVSYLRCEDGGLCVQGNPAVSLTLPVATEAAKDPAQSAAFEAVRKAQPLPNAAWKVSVTPKAASWVIRTEPGAGAAADPGKIYFFDAAAAIATDAQEWKKDGAAHVLEIAKKDDESTALPWGYLWAEKSWLEGGTVSTIPVGTPPAATAEGSAKPIDVTPPDAAQPAGNVDEQIATIRSWGVRPLGGGEESTGITWPLALFFAFVGGMILNLMPCVFPVLGLKILGFVRQSGEDHAAVKKHGLIYALGVILSVWALAGVLLAVRSFGERVGWGFQLENPLFLTFLILLLFALSLNLAGVFEFGARLTSVGSELQSESGYKGSLFSGLLTVLVATPCTGPFMGPALGFALSADTPAWLVVAVFTMLALGLALPYVILSYFPALVKRLPRPGAWMETFKQLMAFPMFATVVWLLTVFAGSTGESGLARLLFALVIFAMALWFYGRFSKLTAEPKSKRIAMPLAVICTLGGGWLAWEGAHQQAPDTVLEAGVVPFSPQIIIERRAKGLTTVVDCWASWCLQCELNRKAAFDRKDFRDSLPKYDAIFMLADKTKTNRDVDKFLTAYKAGGIPYALIFPPAGPAIELPSVIASPQTLIDGLEEAKKQGDGKDRPPQSISATTR